MARVRPDVVFNATAWNRVDAAEAEPAAAFAVNAFAPHFLARAARDAGALLVHYSTDYVFDGTATTAVPRGRRPAPARRLRRLEARGRAPRGRRRGRAPRRAHERRPRPRRQRAEGRLVRRADRRAGAGRASRCASSPTRSSPRPSPPDLAAASIALVRAGARGLFHVTNAGSCSWHDLAVAALAVRRPRRPGRADRGRRPRSCPRAAPPTPCSTARATSSSACRPCAPGATRSPTPSPAAGHLTTPAPF